MAAVTTAIIGAAVATAGLGFSIHNSQVQTKMAGDAQDKVNADAKTATDAANQEKLTEQGTADRDAALSNERRRAIGTPAPTSSTSFVGSSVPSQTTQSPATVTRGSGTLIGS